jgi:tetratricopeptide (TPR) repeat protein
MKMAGLATLTLGLMLSAAPAALAATNGNACPTAATMPKFDAAGTIPGYGRGATPEQRRMMEGAFLRLSSQYGVCRNTLFAIAQAIGVTSPGTDLEEFLRRVEAQAKDAADLRKRVSDLTVQVASLSDPAVRDPGLKLLATAQQAVDEGRLADAEKAFADLQALRGSQFAVGGDVWLAAVQARAKVRRLQQDYGGAVALLRAARQEEATASAHRQFALALDEADTWYGKGDERGDNDALREAIRLYRDEVLALVPREKYPDDWAMTQNNLGNALRALGERESGTARLEEAVAAYRAALDVFQAAKADYYIDTVSGNLARAENLLQQRKNAERH